MKRDIEKFKKELTDYINQFIVGNGNTYIKECRLSDELMNRGHAIPITLVLPEEYDADKETGVTMGPCFYAEELIMEYPNQTVAFIAEMVNKRVSDGYPQMLFMIRSQADATKKTIDDYKVEDLVISAVPAHLLPNGTKKHFITKDVPETKLTLNLKAVYEIPGNDKQVYFMPINKHDGRPVTDKEWKMAAVNTLSKSDISVKIIPSPIPDENGGYIPVAGNICDRSRFYDWFYLASPKDIWGPVVKETGAEKIYIIPVSSDTAAFVIDNEKAHCDDMARALREKFTETAFIYKAPEMPVFVLDAATFELKNFTKGGSGHEDK